MKEYQKNVFIIVPFLVVHKMQRFGFHVNRLGGATVARLTPDQKVVGSNPALVIFSFFFRRLRKSKMLRVFVQF